MRGSGSLESAGFLKNCYRNFPQNLYIANNYALCLIKNKMIDAEYSGPVPPPAFVSG
jgi:hypothetical protein